MLEEGLVGYWKLKGDCKDYSGNDNHGVNFGVDLVVGEFNGVSSHIEVADSESMNFGTGDFSICTFISTERYKVGVIGDILSKYDPLQRKGLTLGISASSGGYNSQGNDEHVHFGIDNGRVSDWEDCGRPDENSNFASSLTVFNGELYVAITDSKTAEDWCHVYRYKGGANWEDCGRVGNLKTHGVGPMIIHDGELYAATWNFDWTRAPTENVDNCHVYHYMGGREWEDLGHGEDRRLFSLASYKGRLYVVSGVETPKCYVYEGDRKWRICGEFPASAHPMAVHDGKLYAGIHGAEVRIYDGVKWDSLGNPLGSSEHCNQIHSLGTYGGEFLAGTWPEGTAAAHRHGRWESLGRLGVSTEINALTVYNGKLYAGSIPQADVYRYDGGKEWTLMRRFYAPGLSPDPKEWARLTSLTVYDGKLFASIGSCTGSILDAPCDVRGKVYCFEVGKCVSYDYDLSPGWKHIAAIKEGGRLKLYVNGELMKVSPPFDQKGYDTSAGVPLKIGFGETAYFSGRMREIRIYDMALNDKQVKGIYEEAKDGLTK